VGCMWAAVKGGYAHAYCAVAELFLSHKRRPDFKPTTCCVFVHETSECLKAAMIVTVTVVLIPKMWNHLCLIWFRCGVGHSSKGVVPGFLIRLRKLRREAA
jgi:hypothetical protein